MSLKNLFSKKIIALLFLLSASISIGYLLFPLPTSLANVCYEVAVGNVPQYSVLVDDNLYVINYKDSEMSVIDVNTNLLVDTIDMAIEGFYYSVLVGDYIYSLNYDYNFVKVVDTNTNTVVDTIAVAIAPRHAELVGTDLYVMHANDDTVYIIDTLTNTVSSTIALVSSGLWNSILIGTDLYVLNTGAFGAGTVSVIDTLTKTVTTNITVEQYPYQATLSGTNLYVLNYQSDSVSVIDINTNTVTSTITVGSSPVFSTLVGTSLYVLNQVSDNVSVINTNTDTVVSTISVGSGPIHATLVGTDLYVANQDSNNLSKIDTNTNTVTSTISVGSNPYFSTEVNNKLFVFNAGSGGLTVLDLSSDISLDVCIPALVTAAVDGDTVTLTYDEDLDVDSLPSVGDFTVTVGGSPVTIDSILIEDEFVYLTLANPVVYGNAVAISYVVPATNPTQDPTGNDALAFSDTVVTNNTRSCGIIDVGTTPYSSTLVGNYLYVINSGEDSVSVVDTLTNLVTDTISVGSYPLFSVAVDTDLYVFNYIGGTASIIDTTTNTVTSTETFSGGVSAVLYGTDIYVNNYDASTVDVVDTLTNTVSESINVGNNPIFSMLVGTDIYVFNAGDTVVSVIDVNTNTVTDSITVDSAPNSATLVGTDLYVNNYGGGNISVIDTISKTVTSTISLGDNPQFSVLVGDNLYISMPDTNTMIILDTNTNTVSDTLIFDTSPSFVTLVLDEYVYVVNTNADNVTVIGTNTNVLYVCPVNFTLRYTAGTGGSIEGSTTQTVGSGEDGSAVTAVANSGYEFVGWSDLAEDNPRTDTNVLSNLSVTANFTVETAPSSSSNTNSTGTNVYARFKNLMLMGKFDEAYKIVEEFPNMFTTDEEGWYTFCDSAFFTNFMKQKDIDGKYSTYYDGTVTEVSKLQGFVNKLFIFEYLQASGPVDSIFGPLTKQGVVRLQNLLNRAMNLDEDLDVDGIVGPFTRSAINDFCLPN